MALTGYVVPGCVEDGPWMRWGNSCAAVVLARFFFNKFSNKSAFVMYCFTQVYFGDMYLFFPPRSRYELSRCQELFSFMLTLIWVQSELI